ncbi:MAG: sulfatase-like hydrolase/transferase, partial [Planctomycetota bacterium]|nr:sulfatase-like hydrolase/transferase [Planctomycetota bacterium]
KKHIRHLYRANLATVDQALGPILDLARSEGTLLVVTSDHGEGLGEHNFYGHGPSVHRENLHIPLIYRGPGVEIGVDTIPASTVDLRPTLVEMCELFAPLEPRPDGYSLLPRLQGTPPSADVPRIHFSGRYGSAGDPARGFLETGNRVTFQDAQGEFHTYDLNSDPNESLNLWEGGHSIGCLGYYNVDGPPRPECDLFRIRRWQETYRHLGELPTGDAPNLTVDDKADLNALGYGGD